MFFNKKKVEKDNKVSNLEIYNVKKSKKYKLRKIALTGMIISVIGSSIISFSGHNTYSNNENYNTYNKSVTVTEEVDSNYQDIVGDYANETYLETTTNGEKITYTEEDAESFLYYLSNYDVEYLDEELFYYDEATEFFDNNKIDEIHNHTYSGFIVDGKVDEEKLFESVKENSPKFRKENNHYLYTEITDDSEYRLIISYVAESINHDLPNKSEEEIRELDCVLGNLTIFEGVGVEAAKVTTENALLVNPSMIEAMRISSNQENTYRNIIYHETKHLEQSSCIDRENDKYYRQGLSLIENSDELLINPYNWTWSTEGAAELGSNDMTGENPTTYKYLVSYLKTLNLISILNGNETCQEIENTSINRNIDYFYELLGTNNDITKEEIVKMMYAMEITQKYAEDHMELYETMHANDETFDYTKIRETYRSEFLIESTKIFYANLANKIINEDLTLEDIFCLMTLYEGDLSNHIPYNESANLDKEYNQNMLLEYNNIQANFFESLSNATGLSIDDLYQKYNSYSAFIIDEEENITLNANLSFLNETQIDWLINNCNPEVHNYTKPVNLIFSENLTDSKQK